MLGLPHGAKIYFCSQPVDFRKGFEGLSGIIESAFEMNVLDGHLFLFVNRRRDRIKALWWEPGGLILWYKKLESHYPHFFLFTEFGGSADNFARRPEAVG